MKHILRPALGILLAAGLTLSVSAAEMDSRATHCFAPEEFSSGDGTLAGICLTALPEKHLGTVMLGERVLRPGDVLTACQVGEMTFVAGGPEGNATAAIRYLPVFSNGLAGEATMTLSIRGRENKPPIAQDGAFETYKNLEITNHLKVRDPEEQEMTFCLVREPKRGTVVLKEDGSFTYTPKKNKVGIDSFVYTATDAAGKTSREATVTIQIRKPTDASQYSDTLGRGCRFAAEWMKNTGIFTGECIGGSPCFSPDKEVSRGEFVTMLVKALQIPTDSRVTETGYPDVPEWLRPYLAAAIRSGLTSGLASSATFAPDQPVTCADAAAMLCAAQELRQGTNTDPASRAAGANIASKMTPTMIFEYMGIRLDTMAVPDLNFVAVANLPEGSYTVRVHNGVILYQTGITCDNPDVVWNTNTTGLVAIATNKTAGIEKLVQQEGDTSLTTRLAEAMVELSQYKFFHIVEP